MLAARQPGVFQRHLGDLRQRHVVAGRKRLGQQRQPIEAGHVLGRVSADELLGRSGDAVPEADFRDQLIPMPVLVPSRREAEHRVERNHAFHEGANQRCRLRLELACAFDLPARRPSMVVGLFRPQDGTERCGNILYRQSNLVLAIAVTSCAQWIR